jgi:ATP-dependent RNA helicase DeaD
VTPSRSHRTDRPDRPERAEPADPKPRRDREKMPDDELETYRVEVGRTHGVKPANLVGAIANEAGLDSANIGKIEIFEDFSHVDLPIGMPKKIFKDLQKVWVSSRQLRISLVPKMRSPRGPSRK